jgi:hypothetical protein
MTCTHLRTQFYGSYFNTALQSEEWSVGLNWIINGTNPADQGNLPTIEVDQTNNTGSTDVYSWRNNWLAGGGGAFSNRLDPVVWGQQLLSAWGILIGNSFMSDQCTLKGVKMYPIAADGKAHDFVADFAVNTPARGAGTSGMLPPQCSIVASLVTPVLGASGRGRCYLPGINRSTVEAFGTMTTGGPVVIANAFRTFLNSASIIGTVPLSDHWVKPIVCKPNGTTYGLVKSVRVGSIIDTQRRRRNQLPEMYEAATL